VDLIYLDPDDRVIQEVEPYPASHAEPYNKEAASALVLLAHTIDLSQT
jgi:hypothetical protein